MKGVNLIDVIVLVLSYCTYLANSEVHRVSTAAELQNTLKVVQPGDVIQLAGGTYNGKFIADRDGAIGNMINVTGSTNAILQSSTYTYGFHLKASYWKLRGFSVKHSKKAIMVDYGRFNILENLVIDNIQEEGVHFRYGASDNILQNSTITNCGTERPGYGEGVYVGSDSGKWDSPTSPDKSDRNEILNNIIGPGIRGEGIDIKEGTCCGVIKGNTFNGHGLSNVNSDDSWVDIKGNEYLVQNNTGKWTLKDGYQIRDRMPSGSGQVSGCNNIFKLNKSDLQANGVCFFFANKGKCTNTIQTNNECNNAAGMSNL